MKKKMTVIILSSLIAVLVCAMIGVTYAWLTDEDSFTTTYTMGDVSLTVTTDAADKLVVPGESLTIANSTVSNTSNVATNMRIKFDLTGIVDGSGAEVALADYTIGTDASADEILFALGASNAWVMIDNFAYLGSCTALTTTPDDFATNYSKYVKVVDNNYTRLTSAETFVSGNYYELTSTEIAANATPETFDTLVSFNGNLIGNAHSGYRFTFTVTYQLKQAEYVDWADLATINFETGLAN